MTFKDLLNQLQRLTAEQLEQPALIYDSSFDSYFPAGTVRLAKRDDPYLDMKAGQPYLPVEK